jgi:hypothetical protein
MDKFNAARHATQKPNREVEGKIAFHSAFFTLAAMKECQ